jgi:hypothetical protein
MSDPILQAAIWARCFRGGGLEVNVLSGVNLTIQPMVKPSPLLVLPARAKARLLHLAGWPGYADQQAVSR